MSKGQFYYHFKNKEELYLALIDVLIAKKQDFLTSVMQPEDFQGDVFSIFKAQIKYSLAFAREYPAINQFSESFMREKSNPIYKTALAVHNFEDNDAINNLVEAAYQKGDFREDIPLPFIKKTIAFLFTHVVELAELKNTDEVEDNMNHLIEFMKAGLAK
jgi:AcrR family transcriptional regulator